MNTLATCSNLKCPEGWNDDQMSDSADGNCIKFFTEEVTANSARSICAQNGGHLVHIKDYEYNKWV